MKTSYGTRDDGALRPGVPWPVSRFTSNGNGTVTDNLTGLIWLQNANCTETVGGINKGSGYLTWADALAWSNGLASGYCSLTDGSASADWRLPDKVELESLVDAGKYNPALPTGHPFTSVRSAYDDHYWSSSTAANNTTCAWRVQMGYGTVIGGWTKTNNHFVWPVRGGQFGNSVMTVLPLSGNYGNVAVNVSSSQTVTVSNSAALGSGRLQINAIALRGTDPGQFSINPGNGSGGTCGSTTPILNPGASCTVAVTFTPTSTGVKSATLRISGSDVNAPNSDIPLIGTGTPSLTVTGSVSGGNGTISSTNPVSVPSGSTAAFTLTPSATYQPASSVTGTCATGSWNGNTYTTGAITADCTVGFTFTKITYPLAVSTAGTGIGCFTLSTGGGCVSSFGGSFDIGTTLTITPTADGSSVFSGWNGCTSVSGSQCTVTMNTAKSVISFFNVPAGTGVKVDGNNYGTLSSGHGAVAGNGEISLKSGDFYEALDFSRAVAFKLKGGYSGDFSAIVGTSTIRGPITISDGTVTFENIVSQP